MIKILPCDIAVLRGDQWLSRYVERDASLTKYDPRIKDFFCPLFEPGATVVDVGACIGDHTVAYAERVGPSGRVLAFEPRPDAYMALLYNTRRFAQVKPVWAAAAERRDFLAIIQNQANAGATCVHGPNEHGFLALPLDDFEFERLDYMKLDAEGYEMKILQGAEKTLHRHSPIIVAEVGTQMQRYGNSTEELSAWLGARGYAQHPVPREDWMNDAVYDVMFKPL